MADNGVLGNGRSSLTDSTEESISITNSTSSAVRKRNKPTLSCIACVGRKTKCDRMRPICLACTRRQTECSYSALADIIAAADSSDMPRRSRKAKRAMLANSLPLTTPPFDPPNALQPIHQLNPFDENQVLLSPANTADLSPSTQINGYVSIVPVARTSRTESFSLSRPPLFNDVPVASRHAHAFRNLWTDNGGLAEVVNVLPAREEADALVQKYFEITDPIYPIVPRGIFMERYQAFWNGSREEKLQYDPAFLALQFVMFTSAKQYEDTLSITDERDSSSVFYLSCSHQCLRLSSYLNQCSLATIQTMVLVINYLVASHRVSDAWTFSGIATRQAYGLGLHRDPLLVAPSAPAWELQVRVRLWLAIMFQDTSLAIVHELPPGTTLHEIDGSYLDNFEQSSQTVWNAGLFSSIPPSPTNDMGYAKAMWQYTRFVQEHMCEKKALKRPIFSDPAHKVSLISRYKDLYTNFEPPFNSLDNSRFDNHPERLARQLVSLSSNYFFILTKLYMETNDETGVTCDLYGALDASHEALASYFALARLFSSEADTWGAPQMRAYTQATFVAQLLAEQPRRPSNAPRDMGLMLAKSNLDRYIDLLSRIHGTFEFEQIRHKRLQEVREMRDRIVVV